MQAIVFSLVIIAVCVFIAVGGLLLVRRNFSIEDLESNHEVATVMVTIVGTLYAILLGLVVVDSLVKYRQAQTNESLEANALANVMHLSRTLATDKRIVFMKAASNYADAVIDEDWKVLGTNQAPTKHERKSLDELRVVITGYEPKTQREQNIGSALLSTMEQLGDSRRARLIGSKEGTNPLLWVVIICGGLFTVAFTYFFGMGNLKAHALMTGMVAVVLSLNVLLILFFGAPYDGFLKIKPESFEHVRQVIREQSALIENSVIPQSRN